MSVRTMETIRDDMFGISPMPKGGVVTAQSTVIEALYHMSEDVWMVLSNINDSIYDSTLILCFFSYVDFLTSVRPIQSSLTVS